MLGLLHPPVFTNYIQTLIENHFIPTIPNATQPVSRGGEVGFKDRSRAALVVMLRLQNRDWVSILKHTGSGGASGDSGPVEVILLSHNRSRANHSLLILLGLLFLLSESTFRADSSGLERTMPIAGKTSLCVLELRLPLGRVSDFRVSWLSAMSLHPIYS